MSKIYDLYSPDQRKIDNLKRRIRGYQKMEKDLTNQNRKLNNQNRELQQRIDKAIEYINDNRRADLVFKLHLNEEEVDKLLEILKGDNK